MLTDCG